MKAKTYLISVAPFFIQFLCGSPFKKIRVKIWNLLGFQLAQSVNIMSSSKLIYGNIQIGNSTFIGDDVTITGGEIIIGENCDVAPGVMLHAGTHQIGDATRRAGTNISGKISIGNGCWIGTRAVILDGVFIGDSSIVAAGSVVKSGTYPSNSLIAGCPARVVREIVNDK